MSMNIIYQIPINLAYAPGIQIPVTASNPLDIVGGIVDVVFNGTTIYYPFKDSVLRDLLYNYLTGPWCCAPKRMLRSVTTIR
jgi:hypothetical protein